MLDAQPESFQRGAIVARRGKFAVVWEARGARLLLLPITWPEPRLAGDVSIGRDLDLYQGCVVRTSAARLSRATGQSQRARLPPGVIVLVARALLRVSAAMAHEAMWSADQALKPDRAASRLCQ